MQHQYHLQLPNKSYPLLRSFLERTALVEVRKNPLCVLTSFTALLDLCPLPSFQETSILKNYIMSHFFPILGAQKLAQIRENSNFFRSELQKMGFEVLGDNDSPVMPIMLYNPAKIPAFSRECLKQNVSPSSNQHLCVSELELSD